MLKQVEGVSTLTTHFLAASERTLRHCSRSTTGASSNNSRFGHPTRSFVKRYLWITRPGCMAFEAIEKGKTAQDRSEPGHTPTVLSLVGDSEVLNGQALMSRDFTPPQGGWPHWCGCVLCLGRSNNPGGCGTSNRGPSYWLQPFDGRSSASLLPAWAQNSGRTAHSA